MKLPNQKLYQVNSLFQSGLDQFKSMLFSLSQNEIIDEVDKEKLVQHLQWMTNAPIKSFDYDWDTGKTKIVIDSNDQDKNEVKKQLEAIWDYVYEYILNKYSKKDVYRASGHFIDQKLNQAKIIKQEQESDAIAAIGHLIDFQLHKHDFTNIKLSPPEEKLIRSILMLLHLHSDLNFDSDDYYAGNGELLIAEEGYRLPHLKLRPIDLYKAYTSKDSKDISGAEIAHVKKILFDLEKQFFNVTYRRVVKKEVKGKEVERVQLVSMNKPLFKVISFLEISKEEEKELEQGNERIRELREELILALHPIFIDQIKTKYIEFPFDITRRIEEASGGAKSVAESTNLLIDYLMREKSSKRFRCEIDYLHLVLTLGLNRLIERGEKARTQEKVDKAISVAQSIGLVERVENLEGSKGQEKIIFHINPKFK